MPSFAGELINTASAVAALDDAQLRGGFRVVADLTARDALVGTDFIKTGAWVFVISNATNYQFNGATWDTITFGGGGGGSGDGYWDATGNDIYNNNNGSVGIGTTSPTSGDGTLLDIVSDNSNTISRLKTYSNTTTVGPILALHHSGGTEAAETATLDQSRLGTVSFVGFSTVQESGARIRSEAQGLWSGTNAGANLTFWTTEEGDATRTLTERMCIADDGNVGIGITPTNRFHVFGGNAGTLLEASDGAAATVLYPLVVQRSTTGTAADGIGTGIAFQVERDDGAQVSAGEMTIRLDDANVGTSEDASIEFTVMNANNPSRQRLTLGASEIVFNDDSDDVDVRMESDGNTHAFFLESSSGNVGIGTTPSSRLHILDAQNTSTDLRMENSSSGTSGQVQILALSNAATGFMSAYSSTNTATLFAGSGSSLADSVVVGGGSDVSGRTVLGSFSTTAPVQIGANLNNVSFSIPAITILATNQNVGIGTDTPDLQLHVESSTNVPTVSERVSTDTGASGLFSTYYARHRTTANMADGFGAGIAFQIEDPGVAGSPRTIGAIGAERNGADGTGDLVFYTYPVDSSPIEAVRFDLDGNVGIGTSSPDSALTVTRAGASTIRARTFSDTATDAGNLGLHHTGGTEGSPTATEDGWRLGSVQFIGYNGTSDQGAAQIFAFADGTWSGSNFGTTMSFRTVATGNTGAAIERMGFQGTEVIFNEDGEDFDFRVEGNTDGYLFFIDASTDRVGVSTNTPTVELEVNGRLVAQRAVEALDGYYSVDAITDNRKVFTNEGVTVQLVPTLPTAVAGLEYEFIVQDADGIRITAASGDTIRQGGSVSAAGGTAESTTIGDTIRLVAINATEWIATASQGTWTLT